jgi:ADP-heptose:LPS heptosyltransferase
LADQPAFLFSGTLGDAYIALCKLDSRPDRFPCTLQRMCRDAGSDVAISELASLFANVEYLPEFIQFETIPEMRDYAFAHARQYISIFFDGHGRGNEPDDAGGIAFNPYPKLDLMRPPLSTNAPHVGIQMHSGSRAEDQRRLDIDWVMDIAELLAESKVETVLLGTGDPFERTELERLRELPPSATNLIGCTSLLEWLGYLSAMDYVISPDGLAAFFAMSQRVPTLMAFQENLAVLRLHESWRANAVTLRPHVSINGAWIPLEAEQATTLVLSRIDPDRV